MNKKPTTEECNHTSVGVIVERDGKFLVFQRVKPPYGIAPCAGHVNDGESYREAAVRELAEETGLRATSWAEVWTARVQNPCRRKNGHYHIWKVYRVTITDDAIARGKDDESKNLRWLTGAEIEALIWRTRAYEEGKITSVEWQENPGIEPVWAYFFNHIGMVGTSGSY